MFSFVVSALLAVGCSAVVEQPDPMTLQRGEVSANGSLYAEMSAMSEMTNAANALEAKMKAKLETAECQKVESTRNDKQPSGKANAGIFNRPWTKDMVNLRDGQEWGMKPVTMPPRPGADVKMAFIFFANDRIDNEDIWLHWMDEARDQGLDFAVHIHAYGLKKGDISQWRSDRFKKHVSREQARTTWCQMFEAQMLMLEKALEDPSVTHLVTLSSDSVPVKPMAYIYNKTRDDPLSRFCVDDYWRDPWPRAETWSMMRRADAMFFAQNKEFAHKNFRRDCQEETAWYFPLRVRWDNFRADAAVKKECIMFTNWKDGEKACKEAWANSAETCNCPTLRKSSNSTPANFKHPVIYSQVSADAFEELVRSPFWFARKFTADAVPEQLKTVLNIDLTQPKKAPKRKRFGIFR
jgi:hypothetical protein